MPNRAQAARIVDPQHPKPHPPPQPTTRGASVGVWYPFPPERHGLRHKCAMARPTSRCTRGHKNTSENFFIVFCWVYTDPHPTPPYRWVIAAENSSNGGHTGQRPHSWENMGFGFVENKQPGRVAGMVEIHVHHMQFFAPGHEPMPRLSVGRACHLKVPTIVFLGVDGPAQDKRNREGSDKQKNLLQRRRAVVPRD